MLGWVRTILPSRFQFKFEKRSPNWGPRNLHKECAHPNGWRDKHTHTHIHIHTHTAITIILFVLSMISAVMNMHYFAICNLQSDHYNGYMRACLSYQCCSNTDLLVIIIIFVSVKLTSQKILEGEKRANLRLKKNVKFNRELDTAKVNCRNPNSTEASIIYSGCKYWFSCHQNKYLNYFLSRLQILKLGTPQVVNIEIGVTKQVVNNSTHD